MLAPNIGVPKHKASITDSGLFSYHSEGITEKRALLTKSFISFHCLKPRNSILECAIFLILHKVAHHR